MPIVVLGGKSFWQSLSDFIVNSMLAENTISPSDSELISYVQSPDEIINLVKSSVERVSEF
jgi:predicted Rossmann-fold nucleotide-binding protein